MKKLIITALALSVALLATAQTPQVTARVEPDSVMIGDRFDYIIEVEKDMVQVVDFPEFHDQNGGLEMARPIQIDTLERDGRRLKLRARYTLAAFQEGNYNLGVAKVLYADKNIVDTLSSRDSIRLKVATYQIDSTSQSIFDIKGQKSLPFKFAEIQTYVIWGIIVLLILAGLAYALHRYMRARGRRLGDLFKPAPPLPPHIAAIRALEELHNQKLWQSDRHKLYYSTLTDIIREYIDATWNLTTMESTSDQIVEAMRSIELPQKAAMDLSDILRNADLVKFAKHTPEADQNEDDYLKAYYFIEQTKPDEQSQEQEDPAIENPKPKTKK